MNRISLALISATAAIALTQSASAADLPYKAPPMVPAAVKAFSWTGCYIGANAGWGRADYDLSSTGVGNINANAEAVMAVVGSGSMSNDGFTGGGQIGCNWQLNSPWVIGVEGDIDWTDASASRDTGLVPVNAFSGRSIDDVKMNWVSTIRGRVGWAFDRVLVYGTVGAAFTSLDITKNFSWTFIDGCTLLNGVNDCHVGGTNSTLWGWTVGGGAEWAFDNHWSVKAEYLWMEFQDATYYTTNANIPNQFANHSVSPTYQRAVVGINYKF